MVSTCKQRNATKPCKYWIILGGNCSCQQKSLLMPRRAWAFIIPRHGPKQTYVRPSNSVYFKLAQKSQGSSLSIQGWIHVHVCPFTTLISVQQQRSFESSGERKMSAILSCTRSRPQRERNPSFNHMKFCGSVQICWIKFNFKCCGQGHMRSFDLSDNIFQTVERLKSEGVLAVYYQFQGCLHPDRENYFLPWDQTKPSIVSLTVSFLL